MSDFKMQLIQQVELALSTQMDPEQLELTVDTITQILKDYDVAKASTEIVPYNGVNSMLLNAYCGCLMIGGKSEKTIAQYRRTAEKLASFSNKTFLDIGVYDIRLFMRVRSARARGQPCTFQNSAVRIFCVSVLRPAPMLEYTRQPA